MSVSLDPIISDLRLDGHSVRVMFGVWTGDVVLDADVTATLADKAFSVGISINSGDINDVYPGFQVRVYTSGGLFKGVTNVRSSTISSTVLPIRELGKADIAIVAGDIIRVYNLPFLGDKLPIDDATFAPDNITFTTQGSDYRPRVMSGGHFMGMVDDGETFATVETDGSGSDVMDPTSTPGNITHDWTLLTSTLAFQTGSTSSDESPVIEASAGYGIARHTVTDDDNSTSWYQYVMFQVYDDADDLPGYPLLSCALNGEVQRGWSADVEVWGSIPLDIVPDGSMCAVWVRERIGEEWRSVGGANPGREHLKFIGFMEHDESAISPRAFTTTFRLQSPLTRYASLPGWSKVFTRTATPTDWTGLKGLTIELAIDFLIKYYSWYQELFDVRIDADLLDKAFSALYIDKFTADEQIRQLTDGIDARMVNLRTGELLIHTDPAYIPLADRAGIATLATLGLYDCPDLGAISRDHWKTLQLYEARAFKGGAVQSDTYFSRYPGNTPGRGAGVSIQEKVIADSQADLDIRTGRRAAKVDGTFIDANGAYHRAVSWSPTLRSSFDALDFHQAYIDTTIDETSNGRDVDLSAHRLYVTSISVTYDLENGVSDVKPTLVTATNGNPASTYVPPVIAVPPYTPIDFVPVPYAPPVVGSLIPGWTGVLPIDGFILSASEAKADRMTGYDAVTGAISYAGSYTGLTGTGIWFRSNPYNYKQGYALTTAGIEYIADQEAGGAFSVLASNATIFGNSSRRGYKLLMSHLKRGWMMALSGNSGAGVSFDYGATWTQVSIDGGTASWSTSVGRGGDVAICGHDANHLYSVVQHPSDAWRHNVFKSVNGGLTWTQVNVASYPDNGGGSTSAMEIQIPYKRSGGTANRDDGSLLIVTIAANGLQHGVSKSVNGGVTWAGILREQFISGRAPSHAATGDSLNFFTHDADYAFFAVDYPGNGANPGGIMRTLGVFSTFGGEVSANGQMRVANVNGWSSDPNIAVAWWLGYRFAITADGGTNWAACNLPSGWADGIAYVEFSLYPFINPA